MTTDPFAVLDPPATTNAHVSGGRMLFYDFETIPDTTRFPIPSADTGDVKPVDVATLTDAKVDEVKDAIKVCSVQDLGEIETMELAREKPRKGVLDAVVAIRESRANAKQKWCKEGSTNPLWCRVVALGWAVDDDEPAAMLATNDDEERELLDRLWSMITSCTKRCGYNIVGFDDTVLGFRSTLLGVDVPMQLDRRKFNNRQAVDLMQLLFPNGSWKPCKDVAKAMEIEVPAGDFDGSQVYDAFVAGDHDQILSYVKSDVEIERELYRLFRPVFC